MEDDRWVPPVTDALRERVRTRAGELLSGGQRAWEAPFVGRAPAASGRDPGPWIAEDAPAEAGSPGKARRIPRPRRFVVVAAAVVCLAAVGVPVALVATRSAPPARGAAPKKLGRVPVVDPVPGKLPNGIGPAGSLVLRALSATVSSGSFRLRYRIGTRGPFRAGGLASRTYQGVSGSGVESTDPYALSVSESVTSSTVRIDPYPVPGVFDGYDYCYQSCPGQAVEPSHPTVADPAYRLSGYQPLASFMSIAELGAGAYAGPVVAIAGATLNGYLDVYEQAMKGSVADGSVLAGGKNMTRYKLSENLGLVAKTPGLSREQAGSLAKALALLKVVGYVGTSVILLVDTSGQIVQATSTSSFSNGYEVTLATSLSDFGAAGSAIPAASANRQYVYADGQRFTCGTGFFGARALAALQENYGFSPSPPVGQGSANASTGSSGSAGSSGTSAGGSAAGAPDCLFSETLKSWVLEIPGSLKPFSCVQQMGYSASYLGGRVLPPSCLTGPGGAGVALMRCDAPGESQAASASCLSATGPHPLSDFTFYPAPDPLVSAPSGYTASENSGTVAYYDGYCTNGVRNWVVFDMADGTWKSQLAPGANGVPGEAVLPTSTPYAMSDTSIAGTAREVRDLLPNGCVFEINPAQPLPTQPGGLPQ